MLNEMNAEDKMMICLSSNNSNYSNYRMLQLFKFFFVCGSSSYDLLERIYVWWSRNRGSMKWKAIVKMAMEWCFVKNSKIHTDDI